MCKVIMTCGKICCGKTSYAKHLLETQNAIILSIDEVMLTLFPSGTGELHDEYVNRVEQYLLNMSLQVISSGIGVILDWGLWTRMQRERIRSFYNDHGISCELHYLDIDDDEWKRRIEKRNTENPSGTYFVDEGLIQKVNMMFEEPAADEIDLLINAESILSPE